MPSGDRTRTAVRRASLALLAAVVVASAALVGVVVDGSSAAPGDRVPVRPTAALGDRLPPPGPPDRLGRDQQGGLGAADGVVPDGVTVFDDRYPAVAKIDPALLGSLRRAARSAAGSGIAFQVDSGWRSQAYQEQLLREAVAKYGSVEEAARWVATPETSAHVSGDAVDIGPAAAAAWLAEHGAAYGLCQTYRNEPWHYELRAGAADHGCPRPYADPSEDPRLQRR